MAGGAPRLRQLLPLGLAAGLVASPAFADPAIWKVSDNDSSIHLFGSVHVFMRPIDWRTPQFDALLNDADKVVFEVVMDLEAYATVTQFSLTQGRLDHDRTLADVLDAADYARLVAATSTAGIDLTPINTMQPWLAAMTLATASETEVVPGVELQVQGEVPLERQAALETAEQQMRFFSDAPMEEQVASLMSTIAAMEAGSGMSLEPLIAAWANGQPEELEEVMLSMLTPSDQPAYERLFDARNAQWIGPLESMLADNSENLVIVGAGHLVGPGGVPALLAARGYTVERIDAPDLDRYAEPVGTLGKAVVGR